MSRTCYWNFKWGLTGETQSMLVEDGIVVRRGPDARADDAVLVDLGGKFLLPALTDCHCHILPTGLDLDKLHLGSSNTREEVLDAVRARHEERPDGWLLAVHYDQNKWGGEHLTRDALDAISNSRPILLRHVNGHASVANSAALQAANISPDEKDPEDGSFERGTDGALNGVLVEGAHERVSRAAPGPTHEEAAQAIVRAGKSMAELGIGAAADMQTNLKDLPGYLLAQDNCPIQIRLYMVWRDVFGPKKMSAETMGTLVGDRFGSTPVIAGIKLFADGAIGSASASIYGAYTGGTPNKEGISGQLMYSPERLTERVRIAHEAGYQVVTHAIGDHAIDLVLDAYEATGEPARHRLEHAMLLSDAQIDRIATLGVSVAMQPEFLVRFGLTYRAQLGPERAKNLKRFRSVLGAGIPLAFSSDRPICAGSPWTGIDCATDRPDGFDPSENISRRQALKRYLEPSAAIDGDAGVTGRLNPGELARAITMESDPLLPGEPQTLAFL